MKIAVFATGWNGEYLRDMYHGLENSQKEFHDSIHLYASFGRLGSGDSFNKSEFDFFELADMEAYDGFLYPSTTIKEGDVKQRLLERIIESISGRGDSRAFFCRNQSEQSHAADRAASCRGSWNPDIWFY